MYVVSSHPCAGPCRNGPAFVFHFFIESDARRSNYVVQRPPEAEPQPRPYSSSNGNMGPHHRRHPSRLPAWHLYQSQRQNGIRRSQPADDPSRPRSGQSAANSQSKVPDRPPQGRRGSLDAERLPANPAERARPWQPQRRQYRLGA